MITKRAGSTPGKLLVTFQLPSFIWVDTVHLAGDFNDWNTTSHALVRSGSGEAWEITLELDSGRTYEFRYRIDGKDWQNDWDADRHVPNAFGGENSVLET